MRVREDRQYSFGLAMVMNGEVYHGFNSAAGELHSESSQRFQNKQAFFPAGPFLEQKDIAAAFGRWGTASVHLVDLLEPEISGLVLG